MTTGESQVTRGTAGRTGGLNVQQVRRDFPALHQTVHGKPLVYLDNAATTQKPRVVLDAILHHYEQDNANIHRGVHALSVRATEAYEKARMKVQRFIGAGRTSEIIFVRGTTEAINLVAQSFVRPRIKPGDEIVLTTMEHHSNIVPWQILREQAGAVLRVAPVNDAGELIFEEFIRLLSPKTRFVSVSHVSNAIGTINPVKEIVAAAREREIATLLDGAQALPHLPVNVTDIGCDFYALSGHKMFGPTGIGALYGRADLLETMPPYQGGGEMIRSVTFEETTYNDVPHKFEAGTPNIAGAVALGAAVDYLQSVGLESIKAHEDDLLAYGTRRLSEIPEVRLIGTAAKKACVLSFVIDGVHPHDAGTILDQYGIAVRTGHHCAQPLMDRYGVPATCRASMALYNTREEIDALVAGVHEVIEVFR